MRLLTAAFILILSSFAHAKDDLWVVELASFDCAYCAEIDKDTRAIAALVDGRFRFAPIPSSQDDPLAQTYFMAREVADEAKIRKALFRMVQKMRMRPKTITETIEYLRMSGIELDEDTMAEYYQSGELDRSLRKTLFLLDHLSVKATPSFFFIRGGDVIATLTKGREDTDEFIRKVEAATRFYLNKGDVK